MRRRLFACAMLAAAALGLAQPARAVAPIQERVLPNGLRILLMEAHNVPMVVMRLNVVAGSRFDPTGREGTAALLAAMLSDHTARHSHRAWAEHLDDLALRLRADAGRDALFLGVTTLSEELEDAVDALAEAALQPGWDRTRFRKLKEDAIAASRKALEDPNEAAARARARLLYGTHPYGHVPGGDERTLARIALADLQALYRAQFRPKGAVLAVSGDVTMERLVRLIGRAFAGWKGAPAKPLRPVPEVREQGGSPERIPMPTRQTLVQFVRLGPARDDPMLFPALLANHVLGGGGFSSRLMDELREKRGLVYAAYSWFSPLAGPGPFVIALQTRADQADRAAGIVRRLLEDLSRRGVSRKELEDARANLVGGFAHRLDSNAKRVGLISMIGLYGLPLDYLTRWTARIEAVSLAQVNEAARRWFDPAAWREIRVGPKPAGPGRKP